MRIRLVLAPAALVLLLAGPALAHGGAWRGPPPTTLVPGRPVDGLTPPGYGTPVTPGPVDGFDPTRPGSPTLPGNDAPGIPRSAVPSSGPGNNSWVWWWTLNRERLLDLKGLLSKRVRQRTESASPHFLGRPSDGNDRRDGAEEAREQILTALLEAAKDGSRDVATGAIIALGKAGDPRAIPVLLPLIDDEKADDTVRESAALALGMIGQPGGELRDYLTALAKDDRRRLRTRCFATLALGFLGDAGALPDLAQLSRAKASNREVPACALVALGLMGDEIVVPDLAEAVCGPESGRERDDLLRGHATASLAMIGSRAGLPAALSALRDRDPQVRRQAALTLGALARPEDENVHKALIWVMLLDRDQVVRAFVAIALGEIASPQAAEALVYAYRKGDSVLAPHAAIALALLVRKTGAPEIAEKAVPFLRNEFRERAGSEMRGALGIALGIAGDRNAVPLLLEVVASGGDPDLRGHAAVALGLIGDDRALPILRKAIAETGNPDVQKEVALALALLGDREAADALLEVVKEGSTEYARGSAAAALGRLASMEQAVDLAAVLADRGSAVTTRAFVAVALGMVMERTPVPLLARIGEHLNHRMILPSIYEVLTFL